MTAVFNKDYRDMIECLQREGVEFMLVGGYAVALHGWPRMTKDIADAMTLERMKEKRG